MTELAIRNNRVTWVLLATLVFAGLAAYRTLPRAEDPGFIIRTAVVQTIFPGASPQRVEELVTNQIEEAVQEMPELDFVKSRSRTGVSLVFVNVKAEYSNMREIWDGLRRKIDDVAPDLPAGTIGPFVDDEFGDVYPVVIALIGDGYEYADLQNFADDIRKRLLRVSDVAKIRIYGEQEERVFVEYNNSRLAELGLSPQQLKGILESRNILISGGSVITDDLESLALEPTGNFASVEDLRRTLIPVPGSKDLVYLGDVARVHRGYVDPPSSMMRANNAPCIGLAVSATETGDVIKMGEGIRAAIAELEENYPIGLDFETVVFQPEFVSGLVNGFVGNLLQAISIVMVVMLVSLGIRTGLIVASLIPTAMLGTLFIMQLLNIGLDQISIAALIIALGMLVDNAIVMSESILVRLKAGEPRLNAAVSSAKELRTPLLTSSLTTAAAFLPIFLAESSVGEYTASLFKVVTTALLTSWVLALTMMPLLCMMFIRIREGDKEQTFNSRFYQGYRAALVGALRVRWFTLAVIVVTFAVAMWGMGFVPAVFMPAAANPRMTGTLDLPEGTSIERTADVAAAVDAYIAENFLVDEGSEVEGITSWSTYVGSAGAPRYRLAYDTSSAETGTINYICTATSRERIDEIVPLLTDWCFTTFPSLTIKWAPEEMGPPVANPIAVRIMADDIPTAFACAEDLRAWLREYPGTRNIKDDWGPRTKKLVVKVNEARARRAGLSSQDVAVSLQTGFSGIETTQYREGDDIIPIVLRSVAADRRNLSKLDGLNVYAMATGTSVPLKQIADIEVVWEPSTIYRRDRQKVVEISAGLDPGLNAMAATGDMIPALERMAAGWPGGTSYELGGEWESSQEGNASIGAKLPIAFVIIFVLLMTQFNSFRRLIIVLLTIPLGLIGVTIGLLVAKSVFGFMTLLGVISLAGIIINNAIVLLDRIRIEIVENDRAPADAIIQSAQQRLRPILLTTTTTVGGLIPLWVSGGPMWEPMAIAIIFGLLFATVLTLGVVPVLYSFFFRVSFKGYTYGA